MTRSVSNALKSVLVLMSIAVVCVGILAVCNMFFPKYTPTLDVETAKLIDKICPTGVGYQRAFDEKYIVMLNDGDYDGDIEGFNKLNKSSKAEVLAVYGEPKGESGNAGAFVIECKATGRDGDVVVLVAFKGNEIIGATCKKQNESYWEKLPDTLFDSIVGETGSVDLKGELGSTGATISLKAVESSVNIALTFADKYKNGIVSALEKIALDANKDQNEKAGAGV